MAQIATHRSTMARVVRSPTGSVHQLVVGRVVPDLVEAPPAGVERRQDGVVPLGLLAPG